MSFVISQPADFWAFNMYNVIGFENMYVIPNHSQESGVLAFIVAYTVILLLIGIPAFAEEMSYFMTADPFSKDVESPVKTRWYGAYHAIILFQNMQCNVAEAYRQLGIAIMQLYMILHQTNYEILKLYTPSCGINTKVETESGLLEMLQPSCLALNGSRLSCKMLGLFYNPYNLLYYSTLMVSILIPVYALSFGRSWTVYCTIGRLYVALIVLWSTTLLLHFMDAQMLGNEVQKLISVKKDLLRSNMMSTALSSCVRSLSLASFSISIFGANSGVPVKRSFVRLTATICLCDLGITVVFTVIHVVLRSCVDSLCKFNSTLEMKEFMNPVPLNELSERVYSASSRGILEMGESIMLFREYSGYVAWTVNLPFQVLMLIFPILLMCNYFLVSDLQTSRIFNGRKWCIICMAVFRFGILIAMDLINVSGLWPDMDLMSYMEIDVHLTFFLLKSLECIFLHTGKGFAQYIEKKRCLIREKSAVQLFFFNWYVAPGITYLLHFGYPLITIIYAISKSKLMLTAKFGIYFLTVNLLPVLVSCTMKN